ncbi:MAG: hypothetical protein HY881_12525 [Deltaproteobacteria bacterium]|nr:hypothetical protein [Deltaproteobacteria bacterium]
MRKNHGVVEETQETASENQGSGKSTGFENVKNIIADKLHNVADALYEKEADQDGQSGMSQYGKQASEWLGQSAECIRQFDYEQADARAREYIGQNPGRSLLIAGGVGLIIGAILRRR